MVFILNWILRSNLGYSNLISNSRTCERSRSKRKLAQEEEIIVAVRPAQEDEHQRKIKVLDAASVVLKKTNPTVPAIITKKAQKKIKRNQNQEALRKARKRLKQLEKQVKELSNQTVYLTEISELQDKVKELETKNIELARRQQQQIENARTLSAPTKTQPELCNEEVIQGWKSRLTNIWFLRSLTVATGLIISSLLLTYSFIFLNTYFTFGNTTSYFPWSWAISYSNLSSVQALFDGALGISLFGIATCAVSLWYCLPRFFRSL